MASATLDGSAFSFSTTRGHTTHISILWVLVLFSVICVAVVLLAGYQDHLMTRKFGSVDVNGNLDATGGITTKGSVNLTADTTLTKASHAGRLLRTNDADGIFTLPTITTDNIGSKYNFVVETQASNLRIATDTTDKFFGYANMITASAFGGDGGVSSFFSSSPSNDVIQLNGNTQGGISGSTITITAVETLKYFVEANLMSSDTVATPFKNTL